MLTLANVGISRSFCMFLYNLSKWDCLSADICYINYIDNMHCVKSVRIWSFSGPYFPALGRDYGELLRISIQSEYGKIRTTKTPKAVKILSVFSGIYLSIYLFTLYLLLTK